MKITWEKRSARVPRNATVSACLTALGAVGEKPLAAMRGGEVLELGEKIDRDCELSPITWDSEEGRRIYERSLRFIMLLAVRRLFPHERVRIEYSAGGHGVFVRLPALTLHEDHVHRLADEMHRIAEAGLPFNKKQWKLEDAKRYFREDGQDDKVALLRYRPFPYFNMYELDGMWEYFYGAMVPSTDYVKVFDVKYHAPGFVLMMPDNQNPAVPAAYVDRPKHLAVFSQSAAWCEILGVVNAADVGRMIRQGNMREFIRMNEALHDTAIGDIAERIVREQKRVVLIAGPTSSGKTTFAGRLRVHLKVLGCHPEQLSLDNYYRNRDEIPLEPDGTKDLEAVHCLDLEQLQQDICALLDGEAVETPLFNFRTGKREKKGLDMRLEHGQMLLIEGIHGLNPMLAERLPQETIHRVFVSDLTCLNLDDHNRIRTTDVRLLRRIVRDNKFRGTSAEKTLAMWPSVRRGEDRWIFPYQEMADSIFNSALHYELPILKLYAYGQLKVFEQDNPMFLPSRRLLKTLHYFPEIDPALLDEIPPTSLMREFIGGCTFDKD